MIAAMNGAYRCLFFSRQCSCKLSVVIRLDDWEHNVRRPTADRQVQVIQYRRMVNWHFASKIRSFKTEWLVAVRCYGNSAFCSRSLCWLQYTAVNLLHNIHRLALVMEVRCVLCAVRPTELRLGHPVALAARCQVKT
jgi:hypothetical protein